MCVYQFINCAYNRILLYCGEKKVGQKAALTKRKLHNRNNVFTHSLIVMHSFTDFYYILFLTHFFYRTHYYSLADVEVCTALNPDDRDQPGPMNYNPGLNLNIFPDLTVVTAGRVANISFYAERAGGAFVSFWKEIDTRVLQLQAKIRVTANKSGLTVRKKCKN